MKVKVNHKKITVFVFYLFVAVSFCRADSLRLKNGELLKGNLVSYSPKTVLFAMNNNFVCTFLTEDIDLLLLSTSNVIIQLAKKRSGVSSFELIGITSESLYLKNEERLFCFNTEPDCDIEFSLENEKNDAVAFYKNEIDTLNFQELWNRILMVSNSKNIIDWVDLSQFNLEITDVLFYETTWNVMKKYIPSKFHTFLWQLMECYTDIEKNIAAFADKSDFPVTQKELRENFIFRVYRLLEKMSCD